MLYTLQQVKDNIRNREGKRVFYLGKADRLTSEARDYLTRERIEILPGQAAKKDRYRLLSGGYMEEKPEHMTHLNAEFLVEKTHPRIVFRGAVDRLEAELLPVMHRFPALAGDLGQVLELARQLIKCDVLEQPVPQMKLGGLDQEQLRRRSHFPQEYYGLPHFMPQATDRPEILELNRLRSLARHTELQAVAAFPDRPDMIQALNRMSSFLYIRMLQEKGK
jgi:ethanolamine utilization cobalamin adenosyltransferase